MTRDHIAVDADSPLPPLTAKGKHARARLLEAGKSVFGEKGFARSRVGDITERAGLSHGAFYRYFRDRRDLLVVLIREMFEESLDVVQGPWDLQTPEGSVRLVVEQYFEFFARNRELIATIVELSMSDHEIREIWAHSRSEFRRQVRRALAPAFENHTTVLHSDLDSELAVEMLCSATEFYALQRFALADERLAPVTIRDAASALSTIWSSGALSSSDSDGG